MIERILAPKIRQLHSQFPVVMLTGPRQSGKTTLLKHLFPELPYVSLEDPDTRERALEDPRGFLESLSNRAILDEIQRVPTLFSYLQGIVDNDSEAKFLLSGSQNFLLMAQVTQSLAGRVAILRLLPLSFAEMNASKIEIPSYEKLIFSGFYPRVYMQNIDPYDFFMSYLETYVERDVRQLRQVGDVNLFIRFTRLCAGRTGQLLNVASLASDAGVSHSTAQAWLSILEASHVIFLLQPHHQNFNKRLVKTAKLYFIDTGLACNLLGLESSEQVSTHYLKGGLFENFVIVELLKARLNVGKRSNLFFWRDNHGNEIDCLLEYADKLMPIEIKSGATPNMSFFDGLKYWNSLSNTPSEHSYVVYGGKESFKTTFGQFLSWRNLSDLII